jgi:hypothetical protein
MHLNDQPLPLQLLVCSIGKSWGTVVFCQVAVQPVGKINHDCHPKSRRGQRGGWRINLTWKIVQMSN